MKPDAETTAVPLAVIGIDIGKEVFTSSGSGPTGRLLFARRSGGWV